MGKRQRQTPTKEDESKRKIQQKEEKIMKVKELKELLEKCDEELEVELKIPYEKSYYPISNCGEIYTDLKHKKVIIR